MDPDRTGYLPGVRSPQSQRIRGTGLRDGGNSVGGNVHYARLHSSQRPVFLRLENLHFVLAPKSLPCASPRSE